MGSIVRWREVLRGRTNEDVALAIFRQPGQVMEILEAFRGQHDLRIHRSLRTQRPAASGAGGGGAARRA
jgi:hypothetical protein